MIIWNIMKYIMCEVSLLKKKLRYYLLTMIVHRDGYEMGITYLRPTVDYL